MTDITTATLRTLLDEASPGPWKEAYNNCVFHGERDQVAIVLGTPLFGDLEELVATRNANRRLISLAPALAEEVIRLRGLVLKATKILDATGMVFAGGGIRKEMEEIEI